MNATTKTEMVAGSLVVCGPVGYGSSTGKVEWIEEGKAGIRWIAGIEGGRFEIVEINSGRFEDIRVEF